MTIKGKVSIIMPCFNPSNDINRAICSCLNQTYKDIEIILVDDGSTVPIESVLDIGLFEKIRVYRKANGGPGSARNYGLGVSDGEFVCFLDADDTYEVDFVERMLDGLLSSNEHYDFAICNYRKVEATGKVLKEFDHSFKVFSSREPFIDFIMGVGITPMSQNKLFRKESLKKDFYPEKYKVHEDVLAISRLLHEGMKFCLVRRNFSIIL